MRDLRIMLVDDHEVVRLGLKALIGRHGRPPVASSEYRVTGASRASRGTPVADTVRGELAALMPPS